MLNFLPPTAKVFIFQADKFLTDSDKAIIEKEMNQFLPQWATHGSKLIAAFEIVNDLFIVVGADESKVETSGCSKDSLNHIIQKIGNTINIDFFNRLNTAYQTVNNDIKLIDLAEFKAKMKTDEIKLHTKVFNNLIETKADLESNWLVEVKNSWHKNLIAIV